MRHIKVKATFNSHAPKNIQVSVRLIDQTHRGYAFCEPKDFLTSADFKHGKVILRSYSFPSFDAMDEVYLRGVDNTQDDRIMHMSLDDWEQVKEAINAYNKEFA